MKGTQIFYRNLEDAHTKRLKTKRPRYKTTKGTKHPKGQNIPGTKCSRDKTSQGTKYPKGTNEAKYVANMVWPIT